MKLHKGRFLVGNSWAEDKEKAIEIQTEWAKLKNMVWLLV